MSADNGIYILVTRDSMKLEQQERIFEDNGEPFVYESLTSVEGGIDAYRVAHAQAIDNFDYYEETEPHNLGAYMKQVWGKSPVFYDADEAWAYAGEIYGEYEWTEYGIQLIDATRYSFYGY